MGNSISLHGFRVQWRIEDTGLIALETYVEEVGTPSYLSPTFDRSGLWSLTVPRDTLSNRAEEGVLYFGLSARPGVRLTFVPKRKTAFLTVRNAAELQSLLGKFEALIAESAAKEAVFFRARIAPEPSTPPLAGCEPETSSRPDKPVEEIPWKDLIDFSR
jgi:hypothetical protein